MCYVHMLCKTGTVCLMVVDPNLIFDHICVHTIRTHMRYLLPEDLALALDKVLNIFTIPPLPPLLSGGEMYRNSIFGSNIDTTKQWVVIIDGFVIRISNFPPPPHCNPYHEHIVGVIYHLFNQIIAEISLGLHRPSDTLVYQPDINHIHRKIYRPNRFNQSLVPNFFSMLRIYWWHLLCISIFPHAL